jgi:AbrB family looped-hinge helix DNA binding protein
MKATVSSKGQVTIPKRLRDRLGIGQGTVLDFHEEAGRLIAEKAQDTDPVTAVYGLLARPGLRTDDVLGELRGEVDA